MPPVSNSDGDGGKKKEARQHALDNLSGIACSMAPGNGEFLHVRGIHPHPITRGHRRGIDPRYSRAKSEWLTSESNFQVKDRIGCVVASQGITRSKSVMVIKLTKLGE